ncbi:hypothetical protein COCNU_scaffold011903G000030 [Cocos nucifera]|nr:hypothetical protein [Cocos nucifera]
MRREGHQLGLVIKKFPRCATARSCGNLKHGAERKKEFSLRPDINSKPKSGVLNRLDGPPTAGVYTKVPTNYSKFTDRCSKTVWASCHFRPACKWKDKAKGNRKLKSSAMDSGDELRFNGVSATLVLDDLYGDNWTVESDGDVEYASDDE